MRPAASLIGLAGAFVLALVSLGGARADQILLLQDDAFPPYMSGARDDPQGLYAAIIHEAQKRLEVPDLVLSAVPWTRATVMVQNGAAQALVGSYYKPEDRPWVRRWSVPLHREEVSVFCRKGVAHADWIFPDDFKGLLFGNVTGYRSPGLRFFDMVARGDIKLEEAQTGEQNLKKLELGRIDCYVNDRLATEMLIRTNGLVNIDSVAAASIEPAYIGYSDKWTGPEADTFIDAMDAVLSGMREDGTIDRIVASYVGG